MLTKSRWRDLKHKTDLGKRGVSRNINMSQGSPLKMVLLGFPGGTVVKNPPANAGDTGSCPGPGRSHMPRSN